ncbi:class I SAM-dependent methyltransferase [uncultured Leifsonia sp.]|uniref:class I SAM-dependent methyltransferase n=1 Tax=uncultured Leifsonia sp. TaxID=340359 RepID=UPI002600ADC7|nr:class I SAM-dependent methyltransferase [uncultured Leifsonia sp.]
MIDETRRQQRAWRKHAASYDRTVQRAERTMLHGSREWVAARARGRVLEVAVGTGRNLPYYSRDVSLVGIDLSPEMLAIARTRAAEVRVDADLRQGDAEALPFEDSSFDTVVCALALCSIPRPQVALGEMARVVVPGGSVVLVDHTRSDRAIVFAGQWLMERFTIPIEGEHLTRRHRAEVEAAGLEVVEHERLRSGAVERIRATRPAT